MSAPRARSSRLAALGRSACWLGVVLGCLLAAPAAAGEPPVEAPPEERSPRELPPPDAWRSPAAPERERAGALVPLEEPAVEHPSALPRVLLGVLAGVGLAAVPNALWLPFAFAGSSAAGVLFIIAMLLEPIAVSVGVYSAHRVMDGEGSYGAALLGATVGLLGAAGVVAVTWVAARTFDRGRPDGMTFVVPLVVGALFAVAISACSVEWSHERSVELKAVGVLPVKGGAQLAASFDF